jgi:DNA-binding MarR family transcriptional regulator
MDRKQKLWELIELFQAIVTRYARLDDMAMKFTGCDRPLFKAELHFLKCVREHPEANLARLASILGVTRGAVSQMLARLEKKTLVARTRRNRKEFAIALTPAGETVYREHEEFHRRHFRELEHAMLLLPSGRIAFIERIFRQIDSFYDIFEKRLTEGSKTIVIRKSPKRSDRAGRRKSGARRSPT